MPVEFEPWVVLRRELMLSVRPWLEVWREGVRLPDGRVISDYYTIASPPSVLIVAVTSDSRVLLARQYKHGVGATTWALPGGLLEPDETPLQCAQRELFEEAGYRAEEWVDLGRYVRDGNRGGGALHVFLALGAGHIAEPQNSDLEQMSFALLTMDELRELVSGGEIVALASVAGILLANFYLASPRRPARRD